MSYLLRDSTFGVIINRLSNRKIFQQLEDRPGFQIPSRFLSEPSTSHPKNSRLLTHLSTVSTLVSEEDVGRTARQDNPRISEKDELKILDGEEEEESKKQNKGKKARSEKDELKKMDEEENAELAIEQGLSEKEELRIIDEEEERERKKEQGEKVKELSPEDLEKAMAGINEPEKHAKSEIPSDYLVGWYSDDDSENPQNWPFRRKAIFTASIMLLTFSVYIGSAIYTPSIPGVMERFHVSETKATLGLSLFVLGYGIGPMILSPLSEIPSIGRNPVYIVTLFLFVIFQIPIVTATNFETVMAFRFLCGFFGSPALATGGASLADVFAPMKLPYVIGMWSVGAVAGPVLGPVVGGFAAMNINWRWPLYELLMLSGGTLIVQFFILPETFAPTLLLQRAQRLRRLTGNTQLRSQSELDQAKVSFKGILVEALWRPFQLCLEPIVLFINMYIALTYAIFYLWFEAFPLTFGGIYHFNLGEQGLPFIGIAIGCGLAFAGYAFHQWKFVIPKFERTGKFVPEERLQVALVASFFIPISLFFFGWSARPSVHWMAPAIAAALYIPGIFLLFQSALVYLPMSYPQYAASLLAGNDLFRSTAGAGFPLFGRAMFNSLTLGGGCSLLAGLSILMIPALWIIYKYGARIRGWSKYAATY